MIGTTAALIGLTAAAAGGGVASAAINKSAAGKAADQQENLGREALALQRPAANEANALLKGEFDRSMKALEGYQPYEDAGSEALNQLLTGLKSGGEFNRMYGKEDFQTDPGFEFTREQGEQALNRSLAAKGGVLGGAGVKEALRFNTGLANQAFEQAFNRYRTQINDRVSRLGGMMNTGLQATNTRNTLGQQAGQFFAGNSGANLTNSALREGEMLTGIGNAQAAGTIGGANAITGGINSGTNGLNQFLLLSQLNKPSGPAKNVGQVMGDEWAYGG
jgi:hypothetical protein